MAAFRRALFGLFAAATLLFGFGSFTAALACPVTAAAQDHSDCCGQAEQGACVLLNCTAICQAIAPVAPNAQPTLGLAALSFEAKVSVLEDANMGPDPPPPRLA